MRAFEELPVSTQTFVVKSDIKSIDLSKCFETFRVTRDLISLKFQNQMKTDGEIIQNGTNKKQFLNCLTVTISLDKKLSVKIFNTGTFQITGCKSINHVKKCLKIIIPQLNNLNCVFDSSRITFYIISVMQNIDFALGFKLDRKKVGSILNKKQQTDCTIPPMTFGYMGVKLKFPVKDFHQIPITKISYSDGDFIDKEIIAFQDFYANKKMLPKFTSVAIFQNGKVLISGIHEKIIKPVYEWILEFLQDHRDDIIVTEKTIKTFIRNVKPLDI